MANKQVEATEAPPQQPTYVRPPKTIERHGSGTQPLVHHYPNVIAGTCAFHGTIDPNVAGEHQYKLCPNDGVHPVYTELQCSYCESFKNPEDVNYKAKLTITDHPTNPNALVVCCDNFSCLEKHQARFKIS